MTVVAAEAFAFAGRFVHAAAGFAWLPFSMAVRADFVWRLAEHVFVIAGVNSVTGLTLAVAYRHVLSGSLHVGMAVCTEAVFLGLHLDGGTFQLVAFFAITAGHRGVQDFLEQAGVA